MTVAPLQEDWGVQQHLCLLTSAQEHGGRVTPARTDVGGPETRNLAVVGVAQWTVCPSCST